MDQFVCLGSKNKEVTHAWSSESNVKVQGMDKLDLSKNSGKVKHFHWMDTHFESYKRGAIVVPSRTWPHPATVYLEVQGNYKQQLVTHAI